MKYKSKLTLHYWSINANLIKFEILPSQYYQRATLDYVYDHTLIMQRGKRIDYFLCSVNTKYKQRLIKRVIESVKNVLK